MPRKPADPNRPAEWFRCMAGVSCHARTNYLGQLVGSRMRARGLVLSILGIASRKPVDGSVSCADLADPITFGATDDDVSALVKSGFLVPNNGEFAVREWPTHQSALIERRLTGRKAGLASADQRELEKVQPTLPPDQPTLRIGQPGATPSSPLLSSSSESDPCSSKRDWDPRDLEALGSDSRQGSGMEPSEVESLLLTIDSNHKRQRGTGRTLREPTKYLSALHKAGRIDEARYIELLDKATAGWLFSELDPHGFNDLVRRVTKGIGTARKTEAYVRTSLATAWHEYMNPRAAAGGAA